MLNNASNSIRKPCNFCGKTSYSAATSAYCSKCMYSFMQKVGEAGYFCIKSNKLYRRTGQSNYAEVAVNGSWIKSRIANSKLCIDDNFLEVTAMNAERTLQRYLS